MTDTNPRRRGGLPLYLAYRAVAATVGALPEPVARRLGEAVGWIASFMLPRRMWLARRVMRRVAGPDMGDAEITRRARALFAKYGRYWAEIFWLKPARRAEFVRHAHVEGLDYALEAHATGRGVIFALPHLGNWEAAGAVADDLGLRVLAAAEALPNERIVDWFTSTRAAFGIDVVVMRPGARVTPQLIRRLEAGGVVALVADRDLKGSGVEVDFFGERTTLPAGPAALAERTGAALLPVGAYFKPRRGHAFAVFEPLPIPDLATRQERVTALTVAFGEALEGVIRRAPEQWHLLQPNWPSDRDGPDAEAGRT